MKSKSEAWYINQVKSSVVSSRQSISSSISPAWCVWAKKKNMDMIFSNMADVIYDDILNQVRNSGLNYQIKVSPFSAAIYLKKSIVKDRSGNFLLPKPPKISTIKNYDNLVSKNEELERELQTLRRSCNEVSISLAAVESQLEALKNKEAMENQVGKNTSNLLIF